jgi:hypothetical protein
VRPNLTLNLGLRWEYFTPVKEKYNNLSNLDLGEGARALLDARVQVGGYLYRPDYNNLGPHLGFAWSPQQIIGIETANRFVLRGGFGIGYNRIPQSVTLNGRLNPPFFGDFRLTGNQILYSLGPSITSFYGFPANPAATLVFDQSTSIPISGAPVEVFALILIVTRSRRSTN